MFEANGDPYLGQVLIDRYRLVELIGQGSMGKVYRAEDQLLGDVTVAVKFLAQTLLSDRMKLRFGDEARTGAQLGQRSIHIVRVLDYGVHQNEVPFYVMEFMEGKNLSDLIVPTPLSLDRFLTLMYHVGLGLQCAHEGVKKDGRLCQVVHRDIKPSNVFVISDPGLGELAKVLDFGIAQFLSNQDDSQSQSFMGTLAYCSPEQIEGKELDGRSDIYSLGITMFELLTGTIPILPETSSIGGWYQAHRTQKPQSLKDAAPDLTLPPGLSDLIMSCMAKSANARPQNMAEILAVLQELLYCKDIPVTPEMATHPQFSPESPPVVDAQTTLAEQEPAAPKAARVTVIPNSQQRFWSLENAGWNMAWPEDKPVAEIVFPHFVKAEHQEAVALWVMLSRAEVRQRLLSKRYNHFLCLMYPHPMVLWITTLYDSTFGPRWLPCYLDLKRARGQKIAQSLSEKGYYPLLCFALEDRDQPDNVWTVPIAPYQRQLFQEWLQMSQSVTVTTEAHTSKHHLKGEFEKLKPKIVQKLEAAQASNAAMLR